MTRRPDLEDLDLLVLVARLGSIGLAARELDLSQPSVSRRVTALERSLRVTLLHRSKRGSTLTPAGRVVVDWATTLLAGADDFSRAVGTLRDQRATLRAAVSMTIAEHYAPRWLARLRAGSPSTAVALLVHNSTQVADLVESGEADIGFLESPKVRRSLHVRRVGWDDLVVAVASGHPWAARTRPTTAEEVAAAPLLVREPGSGTRETLEQSLARRGLDLSPGLELASNTALKSSALAGIGPVVLARVALAAELEAGALVAVPTELELRRPLHAVWRRDRQPSAAALALLQVAEARD